MQKWRGTKKPLDESQRGEWKSWLNAQHSENKDHGIWSHHFMANRWANNGNSDRLFWGAPKSLQMVTAAMKLKDAYSLERVMTNLDSILKSRDVALPTKVCLVKAMVLPVVMYGCELDCEESRVLKNWCFWTVVLEKTLESPLDCTEIQPVHPKGDQSWVFIGRTDAEAETPILWPPPAKSWLTEKDPDAGRGWGQEEKGKTENEMAGWHHRLDGHEFEWTPGVGDGQGALACCNSWGRRVGHDWATELMLSEINLIKTNTVWYHLFVESKKTQQTSEHNKKKQTHSLTESKFMVTNTERKEVRAIKG